MSIKDILVHVDPSHGCKGRLHLAVQLARKFDAYLTGVGRKSPPRRIGS
jgi:hypothetical protein